MKQFKSFKIKGFKAEDRIAEVNFSNDNVTVIFGDNGSGKTTFLKTIFLFLSQDEAALTAMGVQSIECSLVIDNEAQSILVERTEEGYNWDQFDHSCLSNSKSMSLDVGRGISTHIKPEEILSILSHPQACLIPKVVEELVGNGKYTSKVDYSGAHLFLQNIKIESIEILLLDRYVHARMAATRKIQAALFETLSVAIIPDEKVTGIDLPANFFDRLMEGKARIIEVLDNGAEHRFKTKIIDLLKNLDSDNKLEIINNELLSQLFLNMINELEVEKLVLSSINKLIDTFNSHLIENKKLVVNSTEVYVEVEGGRHSVDELSSGERHILTFLTLVLFEARDRNFLIIDEPEISLNIKWQRELMSLLSEILPDTQIIVASHSPALAKKNPQFLSELKVWKA